jgi:hypothetical protein
MMRDILSSALAYLERGWPVIPAIGKQPAVAWSTYQRGLPTGWQVRTWFTRQDREYNVAIITGRYAGLVVVDCDSDEDTAWWQSCFPRTPLSVTTGGDGRHFYYGHPGAVVRNRSRLFGRRIDLRADGGLVIAPPSIHPETRQAYQWDNGWRHELVDIPRFDVRWFVARETRLPVESLGPLPGDMAIRDGLAYIRRIEAVAGNGGHNATFRAACKLRDSGLTADEAFKALMLWNETNASPPWSAKELAHKIDDAYRNV